MISELRHWDRVNQTPLQAFTVGFPLPISTKTTLKSKIGELVMGSLTKFVDEFVTQAVKTTVAPLVNTELVSSTES